MGGNVNIKNPSSESGKSYKVDKPDFRIIDRSKFKSNFINAFKILDRLHSKKFDTPLWPSNTINDLLDSGEAFNGSSSHLFGNRISDEELIEYKPTFGDIDLTVPSENSKTLFSLLDEITGQRLNSSVTYVDKKAGIGNSQINCLFSYTYDEDTRPIYIQIDFEFVEYEKDKPNEFAKFIYSSPWNDVKASIKGVFHKYLLQCLASVISIQKDVILLQKQSPLEPPEKIKVSKVTTPVKLLSFSAKGLRTRYTQQFLSDGSEVLVNGMKTYKEIPSGTDTKSKYEIFTLLFGENPIGNEIGLINSFTGLLQIMQDHFADDQIEEIFIYFIEHKLFGERGQALDATSSETDKIAKNSAINAFVDKFSFLAKHNRRIEELQDDYYKSYKIRSESLRIFGNIIRENFLAYKRNKLV